ncbi:MAG: PD40 domain-containing protein [Chloroflexi bacterium]|nr:PD40 domain-containing protein [Chloroflexota bacterium]
MMSSRVSLCAWALLIGLLAVACQVPSYPAPPTPTPIARGSGKAAVAGGNSIAYVGRDYGIHVLTPDGRPGPSVLLPAQEARAGWPTFSPAGNAIAFSAFDVDPTFASRGVYLAAVEVGAASGASLVYQDIAGIVPSPAKPHSLHWSPDGQRLAIVAVARDGMAFLLASAADGWQPQAVTAGARLHVAWSPDSQSILVQRDGELVRVDMDKTNRPIRLESRAEASTVPAWSPDGAQIAFVASGRGGSFLFLARPDGNGQRPIARTTGIAHFQWSPKGNRLALGQSGDATDGLMQGLRVVNAQSGDAFVLHDGPVTAFFWSPDGGRLAYVTSSGDGLALEWRVADMATGESFPLAQFLPTGEELALLAGFDHDGSAHTPWSPDGKQLVFAGEPAGAAEAAGPSIYVAAADGQTQPVAVAPGLFATWGSR